MQNDMNSYLFFKKSYNSNEFLQCGKKKPTYQSGEGYDSDMEEHRYAW